MTRLVTMTRRTFRALEVPRQNTQQDTQALQLFARIPHVVQPAAPSPPNIDRLEKELYTIETATTAALGSPQRRRRVLALAWAYRKRKEVLPHAEDDAE